MVCSFHSFILRLAKVSNFLKYSTHPDKKVVYYFYELFLMIFNAILQSKHRFFSQYSLFN